MVARAQELVAADKLQTNRPVSDAELETLEASLGRPLPASYVALMRDVGGIGDAAQDDQIGTRGGWQRRIRGPASAIQLTSKLHQEFGNGRNAKRVNECFFFLQWQRWALCYGVDADGRMRALNLSRPGTIHRVIAASFEEWIFDLWSDL